MIAQRAMFWSQNRCVHCRGPMHLDEDYSPLSTRVEQVYVCLHCSRGQPTRAPGPEDRGDAQPRRGPSMKGLRL